MNNIKLHNKLALLLLSHKVIVAILVLGLMVYGYYWVVSPHVNSTPKMKVVISGQFPFSKGLSLVLRASFQSSNPSCKQTVREFLIFPAASGIDRKTHLDLPVKRENGDRYSAEINLDHFSPGFCDWQFGGMSYQFLGGKLSHPDLATALGQFPTQDTRMTYRCEYRAVPKANFLTVICGEPLRLPAGIDSTGNTAELNFIWNGD